MNILKKITSSNYYKFIKKLITLDGDKKFIVSSLTYYLLISLVPLMTIVIYFLKLFNVQNDVLKEIISNYLPFLPENDFDIANLFSFNLTLIISSIISIYIASKGLGNYYHYICEKFNISQFKYSFIIDKIYTSFATITFCFIFGIFISLRLSVLYNFFKRFKILTAILQSLGIFIFILLLNMSLTKFKINIKNLVFGSMLSTILFNFSSFLLNYYFYNFNAKRQYYGLLTDIIALLLYLYFLSYFLMIGNQLNLMLLDKIKPIDKHKF